MNLAPAHFKFLRSSVLNDESITAMGCYSVPSAEIGRLSSALQSCESLLCFPYPGVDGFCRYRIFPPLDKMKYWQPPDSGVHLYILPVARAILSNPDIDIAITEGEKKAACLTQFGIPTIGIGGVWSGGDGNGGLHPEFGPVAFIDRNVLIVFDSDTWIKEEIQRALYALGKAVENRGGKVEALIIPPAPDGTKQGADDFIVANGIGKFKELKRTKLRDKGLAQHRDWWEQWCKKKTKESKDIDNLAPRLQSVEPWDLAVDGVALLDEIATTLKRFVVTVQPEAVVIETLWVVFAHAVDAFGIAPILAFWSPVPECGKTINQSIVGKLVPKPLEGSSLTEAVVFRVVEKFQPTILVDEAADMLTTRPELLSLLRAAHQRNKAFVYRTVGDSHEVRSFSTWGPKSLAITKSRIESALASRCLIVRMHRKTRNEKTERFISTKEYPELTVLQRKAARWVQDNFAVARDAVPDNVPDIENRSLDNFEPLFKIAHVVGGEWPQLIRDAAVKLLGADSPIQESRSVELLKDIQSIFAGDPENGVEGCDRIASADLIEELLSRPDRPWLTYSKGRPITQNQLARLLKDFGVYSRNIRSDDKKILKGYLAQQFKDAFERYIPATPLFTESEPLQRYTAYENNNLSQKTEPLQGGSVAVGESDLTIEKDKQCSGVAVGNSKKDPFGLFRPKKEPEQAPEVQAEPVRYMHANGELREAKDDDEAWRQIKAERAARRAREDSEK